MGPLHVTPVQFALHGSVAFVQPIIPEGHEEGEMADMKESKPVVWPQGLPRRVPALGTRALDHDPGKGPHSPGLEEATKRLRLVMPIDQVAGMVPVRAFDPNMS